MICYYLNVYFQGQRVNLLTTVTEMCVENTASTSSEVGNMRVP